MLVFTCYINKIWYTLHSVNHLLQFNTIKRERYRLPQQSMTSDPRKIWPNGIVPYQIDLRLGKILLNYLFRLENLLHVKMDLEKTWRLVSFISFNKHRVKNVHKVQERVRMYSCRVQAYDDLWPWFTTTIIIQLHTIPSQYICVCVCVCHNLIILEGLENLSLYNTSPPDVESSEEGIKWPLKQTELHGGLLDLLDLLGLWGPKYSLPVVLVFD